MVFMFAPKNPRPDCLSNCAGRTNLNIPLYKHNLLFGLFQNFFVHRKETQVHAWL